MRRYQAFVNNSLTPDYVFKVLGVAAAYLLTAKLGLSLAGATRQVTTIWPPSAIALVALFLGGYNLWPGVLLGAFLANILTQEPTVVAVVIALGNTLEGLTGSYLLRSFGFRRNLQRIWDVICLMVFSALIGTTISATLGALSLILGSIISFASFGSVWFTWWLGDLMGILIFAPLLFLIAQPKSYKLVVQRRVESLIVVCFIVIAAIAIFTLRGTFAFSAYLAPYMMFPLVIWAVHRFEQIGAATSVFIIATVSIIGIVIGHSPFSNGGHTVEQNLILLHLYLATITVTALVVAVIVGDRNVNEQLLKKRNKSLALARASALNNVAQRREAQRKQDYLVNMASHELKTPLTAAKLFAAILRKDIEDSDSAESVAHLDKLSVELDRLSKLSGDLTDASQTKAGKLQIHKERFKVDDAVAEIMADMQLTIARQRRLRLDGSSGATIYADKERFRQVLTNLIKNALTYSPTDSEVVVYLETKNGQLTVKVQDFGTGIPNADQDKVFEPFYRVAANRARTPSGLGLGLYISQQIIDLHKGRIWVDSHPKKGSTFSFSLPIVSNRKAKQKVVV